MNKYALYIGASLVAEIQSAAQLGGNDKMMLKIFWGNLHNASHSEVEIVDDGEDSEINKLIKIAKEAADKTPLGFSPRISAIKAMREAKDWNLKTAREFVDKNQSSILYC